jgi:hypothetical protein
MRYFSTAATVYPEKNPGHRIYLLRGKDLGNNSFSPLPGL